MKIAEAKAARRAPRSGRIGVVITAYKIGPILSDTIQSILNQRDVDIACITLVIDGCGFVRTTSGIANRFGRADSRFHTLWIDNGGVSRARNRGVAHVLDHVPDAEAIFLLDGDDLIPPQTISRNLATLRRAQDADPDTPVGWVYFDQVQFGANSDDLRYPSRFRPARWLASNLSQPSCLYAADLFHAGVFWDEDMRQGIEDWEYWYQAIAAGFRGAYDPDSHLRYRRLSGNRSSLNRSKDTLTKRYMHTKHQALCAPGNLLAAEQKAFPRWAHYASDADDWALTTDPMKTAWTADETDVSTAFANRLMQGRRDAYLLDRYFPDLCLALSEGLRQYVADAGLLNDLLYRLEYGAGQRLTLLRLETAPGNPQIRFAQRSATRDDILRADGLAVSTRFLIDRCGIWRATQQDEGADGGTSGDQALTADAAPSGAGRTMDLDPLLDRLAEDQVFPVREVVLTSPDLAAAPEATTSVTAPALNHLVRAARTALQGAGQIKTYARSNRFCGADKASHAGLGNELLGFWPVAPRLSDPNVRDLGLILPDQPTASLRRLLRLIGSMSAGADIRLHLIGLGNHLPPGTEQPGAQTILLDLDPAQWRLPSNLNYFGVSLFERAPMPVQNRVVGALATLDAAVNFTGPLLAGPMIALKKMGVMTVLNHDPAVPGAAPEYYAHLGYDAPGASDPMSVQSHVQAYTAVIVPDADTARSLESIGVPRALLDIGGADWLAGFAGVDERLTA